MLNPNDLKGLISTIEVLSTEVGGLRMAMIHADERANWARRVAIVGVAAGIIGVAVGILGVAVGVAAQATADGLNRTRLEAQVATCIQANLTTRRTREALIAGVSIVSAPNPERSAAGQAGAEEFVRDYTLKVEAALPYRDCSQAGVDAYYDHPPADPALGPATSSTVVTR